MADSSTIATIIADPDESSRHRITEALPHQWSKIPASSLEEVYYLIRQSDFSLLILELDQPDGDGLALIPILRKDLDLKHLKIACVSRRAGLQDKIGALQAGADHYFVKPLHTLFPLQIRLLLRSGRGL